MRIQRILAVTLFSTAVQLGTGIAGAQDVVAGSFDQLRLIARLGDTLTVTEPSGQRVTGRLATLSPSSLELLADGRHVSLAPSDVITIRQHGHAKLSTGAKIGLGIGAGLGTLAGVALRSECRGCGAYIPMIAAVYGGLGAGIGVGIAALTPTRTTIFESSVPPR
jgi:hypothetical protein